MTDDDEDEPNVFEQLGISRDTAITTVPDSVWDSMLAIALDPNTAAADTSLIPADDNGNTSDDADDLEIELEDTPLDEAITDGDGLDPADSSSFDHDDTDANPAQFDSEPEPHDISEQHTELDHHLDPGTDHPEW